jgi:Protein of unknown function (DUF1461)
LEQPRTPPVAARAALSVATALGIVAVSLAALFNPLWIGPAQERAGVAAITGWSKVDVQGITGAILADVIVGPPSFDAASANGLPVLDAAERGHMTDVYQVLRGFVLAVLLVCGTGGLLLWRHRSDPAAWRAVSRGAGGLALAGVALTVVVAFFFDAAFLAFHLVFFPQGNFSFDPATERLTQLFPAQFWTESAGAIIALGTSLSAVVWTLARRRARRLGGEAQHSSCHPASSHQGFISGS